MAGNAFFWGILSAISLPMGAFLGLWLRPGRKVNSIFMAFGQIGIKVIQKIVNQQILKKKITTMK